MGSVSTSLSWRPSDPLDLPPSVIQRVVETKIVQVFNRSATIGAGMTADYDSNSAFGPAAVGRSSILTWTDREVHAFAETMFRTAYSSPAGDVADG